MKKLLTLFMCLALVGLSSCGGDDDNGGGNDKQILQVITRLKTLSGTYPYPGAYVYVFMDVDNRGDEYTFIKGGTLKKGEEIIQATKYGVTDTNGKATFEYKYDNRQFTVIVARGVDMTDYQTFYYEKFDNLKPVDILYNDAE